MHTTTMELVSTNAGEQMTPCWYVLMQAAATRQYGTSGFQGGLLRRETVQDGPTWLGGKGQNMLECAIGGEQSY